MLAGHSMGGHTAFMTAQALKEEKVKATLLLDPDWCAISDENVADITKEVSNFPLCVLHGMPDLNNPMYINLKPRLEAVITRNTNPIKENLLLPEIGHWDYTDSALTDPFYVAMLNQDGKVKSNGSD